MSDSALDDIKPVELNEDSVEEMLPENRIKTYEECSKEYERALLPHIQKSKVWARIDKLFSGVPPFNPRLLKEMGQTHVVNTDFGDARSKLQKAISSYYNIFYKNKFLADINVEFNDDLAELFSAERLGEIDAMTTTQWSEIITEQWTYSKRVDWKGKFLEFSSAHLREMMLYGVNHIFFPDKEDPIPHSGSIYSHYSPMDAYVDPDRNDIHIVKHEYTLFELVKFYKTDKTGFWNKEALEGILFQELRHLDSDSEQYANDQVSYVEKIIEKLRRHETITNDFYNNTVEVASLYVKEFEVDGKPEGISHLIYTPHVTVEAPIFFSDRAYDNMDEVIIVSTLLPGLEDIQDNKGLGHISFGHLNELTKMKCNFATNIKLSGTTFFRTDSSSLADVKKITVPVSGISVIPDSVKVEHANTNLAAQSILAGVQYLENDLDKNSLFVLNPASSDNAPVGTVQQRAKEAVEMQQNNLAHYMSSTLDRLFSIMFRKELKYKDKKNQGGKLAKRFVERCISKGVPKELFEFKHVDEITGLPSWFRVNAYKGTGTGSQVGDSLKIQEAYQFGIPQKLKSRGGQYFRELEAAAIFGQDMVEKLYPAEDIGDDPTYMSTMASTVANQLEEGKEVVFSPDLDHEIFASILLERMQQVAENYMSQPPTQQEEFKQEERELLFETDVALQALGKFLAMNLTFLAENPATRPLFNNILPMFNRLEGIAQGIHSNAQKARQAQAREIAEEKAGQNAQMQKVIFQQELAKFEAQGRLQNQAFEARGSFNLKLIQAQNSAVVDRIKAVGEAQAKIAKAKATSVEVEKSVDI